MSNAARIGDKITGHVRSHGGHITGWTSDDDPKPIYCSGHDVSGTQTSGVSSVRVNGKPIAIKSGTGTTNCPCDGKGFTNTGSSSTVRVNGKGVVRLGDHIDIHGQGTGKITTGSPNVRIGG